MLNWEQMAADFVSSSDRSGQKETVLALRQKPVAPLRRFWLGRSRALESISKGAAGLAHNDKKAGGKRAPQEIERPKKDGEKSDRDDVGDALRSAYEKTVREDVPPELLELLGKLD